MTAGESYPPSGQMCIVQHQPYILRGTEAIPRVISSRPQGSEQKEIWGRFGPTPPPAGFGVGIHPPPRGPLMQVGSCTDIPSMHHDSGADAPFTHP